MSNIRESVLIQLHHSGIREMLNQIGASSNLGEAWALSHRIAKRLDEFTANIKSQIEHDVYSKDLAIKHYPGKWKTALTMATDKVNTEEGVEYWLLVRRFYLELGGEYIEQLQMKERSEYASA